MADQQRPQQPPSPQVQPGAAQRSPGAAGEPTVQQADQDRLNRREIEQGQQPTHRGAEHDTERAAAAQMAAQAGQGQGQGGGQPAPVPQQSELMTDKMITEIRDVMNNLSERYTALAREFQKQDQVMKSQDQQIQDLTRERDDLQQRVTNVRQAV